MCAQTIMFFFPAFSRHAPYLSVFSPNVGRCGKNTDQNNSEYRLFFRSVKEAKKIFSTWSFNNAIMLNLLRMGKFSKLSKLKILRLEGRSYSFFPTEFVSSLELTFIAA